jgi:hypothetical protein
MVALRTPARMPSSWICSCQAGWLYLAGNDVDPAFMDIGDKSHPEAI